MNILNVLLGRERRIGIPSQLSQRRAVESSDGLDGEAVDHNSTDNQASNADPKPLRPPLNLTENTEPLNPEEIVNHMSSLQADLTRAEDLCKQANKRFGEYREEIRSLKARNSFLEETLAQRDQHIAKLQGTARDPNSDTKPIGVKTELRHARRQLDQEKLKRIEANKQALSFEQYAVSRDLEIHTIEAAQARDVQPFQKSLEQLALLPSQPFVIMLIDGDSYKFSSALFNIGHDAGISIAQTLWVELSKHILSSNRIPLHSKIVVRIFYNGRSTLGPRVANNTRQYTLMEETMIKFAETQPLFDFIDCGGGKERADDKIRENTHLYIGSSDCHAVFLAVCNDNGFARMLERYQLNPSAQDKIVLVAAGPLAREIQPLGFNTVTFPRVFESVHIPRVRPKRPGAIPQIVKLKFQTRQERVEGLRSEPSVSTHSHPVQLLPENNLIVSHNDTSNVKEPQDREGLAARGQIKKSRKKAKPRAGHKVQHYQAAPVSKNNKAATDSKHGHPERESNELRSWMVRPYKFCAVNTHYPSVAFEEVKDMFPPAPSGGKMLHVFGLSPGVVGLKGPGGEQVGSRSDDVD